MFCKSKQKKVGSSREITKSIGLEITQLIVGYFVNI